MNIPTAANSRYIKGQMIPLETAQASRRHRELLAEKKAKITAAIETRRTKVYEYKDVGNE